MRAHLISILTAILAAIIGSLTTVYIQRAPDAASGISASAEVMQIPGKWGKLDVESLKKAGVTDAFLATADAARYRDLALYEVKISNEIRSKTKPIEVRINDALFYVVYKPNSSSRLLDVSKAADAKSITLEPISPDETVSVLAVGPGFGGRIDSKNINIFHDNIQIPITRLSDMIVGTFGIIPWMFKNAPFSEFLFVMTVAVSVLFIAILIYQIALQSNISLLAKIVTEKDINRAISLFKHLRDTQSEKLTSRHLDELSALKSDAKEQ